MATTDANQIAPVDRALLDVRKMLAVNAKGISALLGDYMPPERYCGAVMTLCRHNPDLLDTRKASRNSLLLSVLRIAQLQLSPDPALGQAWIIPRKGSAEFQLGWRGCLALAYRHPLVGAVRYGVVGKSDRFVWEDGRNWRLEHEPSAEGWPENLNDIVATWAIIELRTGFAIPRVMYLPEILRHKSRGQGSQPAWTTDPAAMALKTVIADACRRGPFEGELSRGFQLDHLGEVGKGQPEDDTLTPEYAVEEEGEEPKGSLARFKAAHRVQVPPEPTGNGLDPSHGAAEPEGSGEVLSAEEELGAPSTIAALEEVTTAPPLGPRLLSPNRIGELRKLCSSAGKSWDELESHFGPVAELKLDREPAIVAWIKTKARRS